MPTERVLVEVFTAAHMAGIDQAKAGLLGLQAQTIAMAAAFTILVVVGKAAIENSKKQEEASNLLSQAYATQKDTLEAHRQEIENFLATNARFIKDQYDVEKALAQALRAGNNEADAMRMLNDTLDITAVKGGDVSENMLQLIKVLAGNSKALRELGITQAQYKAIMDSTLTVEQKHAAILLLIEQRYAKGRGTIEEVDQSQNELNKAWQDFTVKIGPPLLVMWTKLNEAAATGLGILSVYVSLLEKIWAREGQAFAGNSAAKSSMPTGRNRGPVRGPVMLGGGPATGAAINININGGMFMDHGPTIDQMARVIVQRLQAAPGT